MSDARQSSLGGEQEAGALSREVLRLLLWRRTVLEGDGSGLTPAEAAAILGISVGSLARRVRSGEIKGVRDKQGRLKILPTFNETPSGELAKLWEEYKATRRQLEEATKEGEELAQRLAAAEEALEHSQQQVSEMWQFLRPTRLEPFASDEIRDETRAREAAKIQGQIADVREWARRRSRHWNRAV